MRLLLFFIVILFLTSCDPMKKYEDIADQSNDENNTTVENDVPDDESNNDIDIVPTDNDTEENEENDADMGISDLIGTLCTGQDKCYSNDREIECPCVNDQFYGQDLIYAQKEYCISKSLTLSKEDTDETITDHNNGLEWQRQAITETFTWDKALEYCKKLKLKGLSDWRLPSSDELWTIVHFKDDYSPAINKTTFPGTPPGSFRTSDNSLPDPDNSRSVYFTYGGIAIMKKSSEGYVRCVRGSQLSKNLFESSTVRDDTLTIDKSTELKWSKTSETADIWLNALEYCEDLNYAGISSWRLPNVNELQSLIDSSVTSPASTYSELKAEKYWASTTDCFYYPTYALSVNFDKGTIEGSFKKDPLNMICVAEKDEIVDQTCSSDRGCPEGKSCIASQCFKPDTFISRWKTNNEGSTNDYQIRIPTVENGSYDFTIYWGDGASNKITTWNDMALIHYYPKPGTYTVGIEGEFEGWQFCTESSSENLTCRDSGKILEIVKWNSLKFGDTQSQFAECSGLRITADDTPDLSSTKSLRKTFYGCTFIAGGEPFSNWDVSTITDMSYLFYNVQVFDSDLSKWDVSNVTDMSYMFNGAKYFNADISGWDVSKVTDMNHMFNNAGSFNRDIGNWNVSNVADMNNMFNNTQQFDQDISGWDVSKVTNMGWMFYYAISFNSDISNWNISNVTNLSWMFYYATSFNRDISNWNISNVTEMEGMFKNATAFNQDISEWDISRITYLQEIFYGATAFDQDLSKWNISNVYDWSDILKNAELSTANYNALLNGWILFDLPSYKNFHAGNSKYTQAGEAARTKLVEDFNWTITDGGKTE